MSSTALAAAPALPEKGTPLPIFTGLEMTHALTVYRELQQALDRAMPDQIMELDGKPFRKKGYWRAIAVAFNLTVEPLEEHRAVHGTLDDGSDNYVYVVTYRAATALQRAATGDGACAAAEKQRGRMRASEHNVRSHAHTRAFNRAVSNLVGFGEVSAEETEHEDRDAPRAAAPARPAPTTPPVVPAVLAPPLAGQVLTIRIFGKAKDNYAVTFSGDDREFTTKDTKLAALLEELQGTDHRVAWTFSDRVWNGTVFHNLKTVTVDPPGIPMGEQLTAADIPF